MTDAITTLWDGPIGLGLLLSRDFMGKDQFRSRFRLPIKPIAYSTERKIVRTGEGRQLVRFLKNPVHTSPNPSQTPTRALPDWTYTAVEKKIVAYKREYTGYTLELVGEGADSITWRLKRLVARRAMRYNPIKLMGAQGNRQGYEKAMDRLERGKPYGLEAEAKKLMIDYWSYGIHYTLRMTAFKEEAKMESWIHNHPAAKVNGLKTLAIDRGGHAPIVSDPPAQNAGRPWFKTTGWYFLPEQLQGKMMDQKTRDFAFSHLSGAKKVRAYIARGPDNIFANFLNLPLEAADLYRPQCPPGTVFTEFNCDLRLEIYEYE